MPLSPASCWQPKLATPSATGSLKKPIRPSTRDDDPQHLVTYGRRKQARIQAKQTHADQTNVARTHAETMARPDANEREAPRADDISIFDHQRALNRAFKHLQATSSSSLGSSNSTLIGYELGFARPLPTCHSGSNVPHTTGSSGRGRTRSAMASRQCTVQRLHTRSATATGSRAQTATRSRAHTLKLTRSHPRSETPAQ